MCKIFERCNIDEKGLGENMNFKFTKWKTIIAIIMGFVSGIFAYIVGSSKCFGSCLNAYLLKLFFWSLLLAVIIFWIVYLIKSLIEKPVQV